MKRDFLACWRPGLVWVVVLVFVASCAPPRAKAGPTTAPSVAMVLLPDDQKVVGWISSAEDLAGAEVRIEYADQRTSLILQQGNTFVWYYKVDKPADATFTCGAISQTLPLRPRETLEPSVFFVVDRTVYRPTQTLHFAAFLREMDERGRFAPLAGRPVEVELRSQQKKTLAAKLKLTSDYAGKIAGDYVFADADPLDSYTLSIPGFRGTATINHAEYRKSKIKLKIAGNLEPGKTEGEQSLKLKFSAVDFLDKPVAGSKVTFVAQVVKNAPKNERKPDTLRIEDFVYQNPTSTAAAALLNPFSEMGEEERLLVRANVGYLPIYGIYGGAGGQQILAMVNQQLDLAGKGEAEHVLSIPQAWQSPDTAVLVQGILVDQNGREQRASEQVWLKGPGGAATVQKPAGPRLQLSLPPRLFETSEAVPLVVKAIGADGKPMRVPASVVAMRLNGAVSNLGALYGGYYGDYANELQLSDNAGWQVPPNGLPYYSHRRSASAMYWRPVAQPTVKIDRELETAAAVGDDGRAELRFARQGAYMLVVVAKLPDGKSLKEEIGCVVREKEDLPGVALGLNRDEYAPGDTMAVTVESRLADKSVLFTIRDSSGLRLWKTLNIKGGSLTFDQKLPAALAYGASVDVQVVGDSGASYLDSRLIHVKPDDRVLTVTAKAHATVQPGETVKVDLQVNRSEAVDLIVSVYDQSLLGIAPDRAVDIRSFYLADDRVRETVTQDRLRRRVGSVTVGDLIKRATELLKDEKVAKDPAYAAPLQNLIARYNSNYVYSQDLPILFRLAGVTTHVSNYYYGYGNWNVHFATTSEIAKLCLTDLMDQKSNNNYRIIARFVTDDTLFLAEHHPSYDAYYTQYGYRRYASPGGMWFDGQSRALYRARGDSFGGGYDISGNSSLSFVPEGQAVMSQLPVGQAIDLISMDPGSGGAAMGVRTDFSDSAYWNAAVRTDTNGKASVQFKLPDSLTNWQVVVTAISREMHVGRGTTSFRSSRPIMVWPMLPRCFTEGDKVDVFASVHNLTDAEQTIKVAIKVDNGNIVNGDLARTVKVPAKGNAPVYWTFEAGEAGFAQLLMSAQCDAGSDASLKRLPITPAAAEQAVAVSNFVSDKNITLIVPPSADLRQSVLELSVAPSLAADMADTLDYLVQYPYGCVEQTMSRFLPAIKVAQILKNQRVAKPDLEKRLPECVAGGIKRLLELQQPDGGWGWNGNGQTHEMMTPYALYGLLEAEKAGYTIGKEDAITRGLARLLQFIGNMNEKQAADRIYCMYVYAHRNDLQDDWWRFIDDQARAGRLSDYALALSLEMAATKGKKELAGQLSKILHERAKAQDDRVSFTTANFSRWGNDPNEITAVALKALVAHDRSDTLIPGILAYFAATKNGNKWNSTKDTAMILYAMCDYLATQQAGKVADEFVFTVNGRRPALVLKTSDGLAGKITIPSELLSHGENRVLFENAPPSAMYRMVFRYWKKGRDIAPLEHGLQVTRRFCLLKENGQIERELKAGDTVPRGAYILSEVLASTRTTHAMRYVLAENPKIAGAEILPAEDVRFAGVTASTPHVLREDRSAKVAWHHEEAGGALQDRCVLHAELAGEYVVAPARVELMYQTDVHGHSGSFHLTVKDAPEAAAASAK